MSRDHVVTAQGSSSATLISRVLRSAGGRLLISLALLATLLLGLFGQSAIQAQAGDGFTLAISPEGMTIREYGYPDVFFTGSRTVEWTRSQTYIDVSLDWQPTADVVLPVGSSDTSEAAVDPVELVFTPANWNVAQRITVSSVEDSEKDGDSAFIIVIGPAVSDDPSYTGIDPRTFRGQTRTII